mmetsp:Transcript_557/g.898  ORF Transcript_557/g.898 Transcript_557/m.898 type:complete len:102 (+) Transcript_557:729-1034(+)
MCIFCRDVMDREGHRSENPAEEQPWQNKIAAQRYDTYSSPFAQGHDTIRPIVCSQWRMGFVQHFLEPTARRFPPTAKASFHGATMPQPILMRIAHTAACLG